MSNIFYKENMIMLSLFGIIFGLIVFLYADSVHDNVYAMIYTSPIIVCVVIALSLFCRYKKSHNFSLAFLFLGLAMLSLLIAEVIWIIMPYLEISQYESYPDIFYLGYAILSLSFPLFILKYYKIHLNTIHYLLIMFVTIIGVLTYIGLSNNDSYSFSFGLGLVFVVLTSLLTGISIITLFVLKNTKIFRVWMIIVSSFCINMIADIWYYSSENTENWLASDFTNIIWFASYLVMIFALSEQRYSYVTTEKKSFKQVKDKKIMGNNSKESDYRFVDRFLKEKRESRLN